MGAATGATATRSRSSTNGATIPVASVRPVMSAACLAASEASCGQSLKKRSENGARSENEAPATGKSRGCRRLPSAPAADGFKFARTTLIPDHSDRARTSPSRERTRHFEGTSIASQLSLAQSAVISVRDSVEARDSFNSAKADNTSVCGTTSAARWLSSRSDSASQKSASVMALSCDCV